jgi:hypothetical protein
MTQQAVKCVAVHHIPLDDTSALGTCPLGVCRRACQNRYHVSVVQQTGDDAAAQNPSSACYEDLHADPSEVL